MDLIVVCLNYCGNERKKETEFSTEPKLGFIYQTTGDHKGTAFNLHRGETIEGIMSDNPKRWLEQALPKKTVQQAAKLMNEQCWCWGADIRYGEGNLLLTYGFRRDRAPAPNVGSNMYSFHPSPTQVVVLWGWGLFYGEASRGGVFIGRNGFAPMMTSTATLPTPLFSSGDLPSLQVPTTETEYQLAGHLTGNALRWVAGYEAWVLPIVGESHRLACLAEWRKRPVEQVLSAWLWGKLADEIESALTAPRKVSAFA